MDSLQLDAYGLILLGIIAQLDWIIPRLISGDNSQIIAPAPVSHLSTGSYGFQAQEIYPAGASVFGKNVCRTALNPLDLIAYEQGTKHRKSAKNYTCLWNLFSNFISRLWTSWLLGQFPKSPTERRINYQLWNDRPFASMTKTPLHRDNFIKLVESGTYDSLTFSSGHHPKVLIQGGDTQK